MIISQKLIEEIDSFVADESLILRVDEGMPALLWEASKDVVILCVQLDVVLVEIVEQIFSTKDFGNFDQLITVAVAVEEWLLPKDHAGEHGS